MEKRKIAIVILNWNGKHFLQKFLKLVVQYTDMPGSIVVVADNGSNDDSVNYVKNNFTAVELIELDKNYGFTGGYNRALQQINAEYFVLLNSDVEVTPGWLQPLVDYLDKNPEVAAVMPKLKSYLNRSYFEYAGAAGGFIDRLGYPFCRGRILNQIEKDNGQYNEISEIFWATGACMFVRAELFHKAGGLDDDFFAHMEEIDLCWKLKNMGYKIMYMPQVSVYHVGGGTLPNENPRKLYFNYRNNLLLLFKNLPSHYFILILISRLFLDFISAIVYLVNGQFKSFVAVIKAHITFFSWIPRFIKKRKALIKQNQKYTHPQIYKFSIVWNFFIRKVKKFSELNF